MPTSCRPDCPHCGASVSATENTCARLDPTQVAEAGNQVSVHSAASVNSETSNPVISSGPIFGRWKLVGLLRSGVQKSRILIARAIAG
jgi:hypothetical protein